MEQQRQKIQLQQVQQIQTISRPRILVVEDQPVNRVAAMACYNLEAECSREKFDKYYRKELKGWSEREVEEAYKRMCGSFKEISEYYKNKWGCVPTEEYEFDFAGDYQEALYLLSQHHYTGMITDCFMPNRTGSNEISLGLGMIDRLVSGAEMDIHSARQISDRLGLQAISNRLWRVRSLCPDDLCEVSRELLKKSMEESEANQPLGVLLVDLAKSRGLPYCMLTARHDDIGEYFLRPWRGGEDPFPTEMEKCHPYDPHAWPAALEVLMKQLKNR